MHKMMEQWVRGERIDPPTQGEFLSMCVSAFREADRESRDALMAAVGRLIINDFMRGRR